MCDRVVGATRTVLGTRTVVAIENVVAAIAQIRLGKLVGQHTRNETLAKTRRINVNIRKILDVTTEDWWCPALGCVRR